VIVIEKTITIGDHDHDHDYKYETTARPGEEDGRKKEEACWLVKDDACGCITA
jgi:hypothetical protein